MSSFFASGDRHALSPTCTNENAATFRLPSHRIRLHCDLDYKISFDDAELLKEFVVESQSHLSDVENQLPTLESQGDAMDVALVNTVFRAVHSIKGAAGFMGLVTSQSLAHREEEVLNKLRSKALRPTPRLKPPEAVKLARVSWWSQTK